MTDPHPPDTADRRAAIRQRLEKATPGPWTNGTRGSGPTGDAHMCRIVSRGHESAVTNPHIAGVQVGATWDADKVVSYVGLSRQECIDNAEFIAHAPDDMAYLLAKADADAATIAQLQGEKRSALEAYDRESQWRATAEAQLAEQEAELAECYRLTGADPDGNENWRLARDAVSEVRRLRQEHDEAEADLAQAHARIAQLEARYNTER